VLAPPRRISSTTILCERDHKPTLLSRHVVISVLKWDILRCVGHQPLAARADARSCDGRVPISDRSTLRLPYYATWSSSFAGIWKPRRKIIAEWSKTCGKIVITGAKPSKPRNVNWCWNASGTPWDQRALIYAVRCPATPASLRLPEDRIKPHLHGSRPCATSQHRRNGQRVGRTCRRPATGLGPTRPSSLSG